MNNKERFKNEFFNMIERKLPELQIYEDEYTKPFTKEEYDKIVLRVCDKIGALNSSGKINYPYLIKNGNIVKHHIDQYYISFMQRINNVLIKVDERINEIIDQAINHSGKFSLAKADPITTLQLYRVLRYRKVNDNQFITQKEYDNKNQYYYHGTKSNREWYTLYLERRNKINEQIANKQYTEKVNEKVNEEEYIINTGYKGVDKIKHLYKTNYGIDVGNIKISEENKNYFPMKENKKKYSLHKVAARKTYLIDLMKSGKIYYLIAINVNTRYLLAEPTNVINNVESFAQGDKFAVINMDEDEENGIVNVSNSAKNSKLCADAMQRLINKGWDVKFIQSDGESGFKSDYTQRVIYERYGIIHKEVPRQRSTVYPEFMIDEKNKWNKKTDPMHGSLGIIDRVIRTIRDMAYNMNIGVILPNDMNKIVNNYNNAPHKGLSKFAGFMATPLMVEEDEKLEEWIVKKICQSNYNVMRTYGYDIKQGTNVKVYNEKDSLSKRRTITQPGEYKVVGFRNGLYRVKEIDKNNNSLKIHLIPRYKLNPMYS